MGILAAYNNSVGDRLGYYMAIIREHGKRKVYCATLSTSDNEILSTESEYPTKKEAFAALGITK